MARYRTVDVRIWMDSKFMKLSDNGKLLFLYLLTSQHTTPLGTLSITIPVLSAWLRKDSETVSKGLRELISNGMVMVDEAGLIWVRNFLKFNPPSNPNCASGLLKFFEEMPDCGLVAKIAESVLEACKTKGNQYVKAVEEPINEVISKFKNDEIPTENMDSFGNRSETVSEPFRNQEQEQEQEQEQKKEKEKKEKSPSLQKPEGVSDELFDEWKAHKKRVSKSCTQRMVNHLVAEAQKAGLTPSRAMEIQLERGWTGFEAAYVQKTQETRSVPVHKDTSIKFDDDYYSKVDPNNPWGI